MYRVSVISWLGNSFSLNADSREEIDSFLLDIEEKERLKVYRIIIKDTGEVIETEKGVKNG